MNQINGIDVPEGLYNLALGHRRRGGKCFLSIPEGDGPGCTNCNGGGKLIYEWVIGGPSETPIAGAGQGADESGGLRSTNAHYGDRWYLTQKKVFTCPMCNGVEAGSKKVVRQTRPGIDRVVNELVL